MTYELRRTGKRIEFKRVPIGGPFFAHGKMWTRTSYEAATKMTYSGRHESTCNFTLDPWDEYVEFVNYVVDGVPVLEDERVAQMDDLKPEDDPANYPKPQEDDEL